MMAIVFWQMLAGAAAAVLLLAALLAPRNGLLARWRRARGQTLRTRQEDALKHMLKNDVNGMAATLESVAGALHLPRRQVADLLGEMEDHGLISFDEGCPRLRESGRELALHVIRAHRLWESYLAEQTGVAEAEWHHRAEQKEHLLSPEETLALAARLGHPTHDPHGDSIPESIGDLEAEGGQSLNTIPLNTPVLITHVEDEPETIYAQLCAEGLRPGLKGCVLEKSRHRIRFWAEGNEHVLAPILANNITVTLLNDQKVGDLFEERHLSDLQPGHRARVLNLSPACRGPERRRLLDLGFVPGTEVEIDMVSPIGDPTAYRIRGTVVALRREQSRLILISAEEAIAA